MGPCPSGLGVIQCVFSDSFNTWMWVDPAVQLPPLGGQSDTVTLSGFSGGCFTSANFHTVFSGTIKGAGLISGGPYGDLGALKPEAANPPDGYVEKMAEESI